MIITFFESVVIIKNWFRQAIDRITPYIVEKAEKYNRRRGDCLKEDLGW